MTASMPPPPQVDEAEIDFSAIRAQGPGGQNVNKVSSAVHLRFDIGASSLPDELKTALRALPDRRITAAGVVVIKAQRYRTQEANRADALERLAALVAAAHHTPTVRKPTRPTRGSVRRRVDAKTRRGETKALRGKVSDD